MSSSIRTSRWRRNRLFLAALVVIGLSSVSAAVAATELLPVGSNLSHQRGETPIKGGETVVATGQTDGGVAWRLTAHKSEPIRNGNDEVQPEGLPCLRLALENPTAKTPIAGSGFCGESGNGGFSIANVPAVGDNGEAESILFGRAPAQAAGVRLVGSAGKTLQTAVRGASLGTQDKTWVLAAPHDFGESSVSWIDRGGQPQGEKLEATSQIARTKLLEAQSR